MDDLLKEAIADAKAVRETALANAKMALEEAFTPKLKSMLAQKIQSEIEDEEEGMDNDEVHDKDEVEDEEEAYSEMKDKEEGEGEDHDEVHDEVEDKDEEEMDEVEDEEDKDEISMEIDDKEEGEGEDHDEVHDEVEDKEEEEDDDDDLDLESILKELEADLNEEEEEDKDEMKKEVEDKDEEEKVDENDVSSDIGKSDNKVNPKANDSSETGAQGPEGEGKDEPAGNELDDHEVVKEVEDKDEEEMDEDIDLEEVLKALSEEEDEEDKKDEIAKLQGEVKEHREVVKFLRDKLNEVNLLNAKLLFSNKLFRAFGLSNEQKLKVVETFDRTSNLREIKLVYSTLAESFKGTSVKPIKESKGSSSKPVASTKPAKEEVISEGAELKNRFKKLANIL